MEKSGKGPNSQNGGSTIAEDGLTSQSSLRKSSLSSDYSQDMNEVMGQLSQIRAELRHLSQEYNQIKEQNASDGRVGFV